MKQNETTKQGKKAGGVEIPTSSPMGQEELIEHKAAEQKGTPDAKRNQEPKRNPPVHTIDEQNQNPKHTGRKPRTK